MWKSNGRFRWTVRCATCRSIATAPRLRISTNHNPGDRRKELGDRAHAALLARKGELRVPMTEFTLSPISFRLDLCRPARPFACRPQPGGRVGCNVRDPIPTQNARLVGSDMLG